MLTDLLLENVIGVDHPAACINDRKFMAHPLALAILAVASSTCHIANDGMASTGEAIEECGLTHIGAAHYGNEFAHTFYYFYQILMVKPPIKQTGYSLQNAA